MKKFSKIIVIILIINLFLSGINFSFAEEKDYYVDRIGGENRILTSINLSTEIFNKSQTVILVGFNGEVDALGGTLLASKLDAPIIMTDRDKLSASTKTEIKRLGAKNVIILGGENVVSKNVVSSLTGYNVERIGGLDREETAIKIAKKVVGATTEEVFISIGYEVYADALSIGPISAKLNKPVLLSKKKGLSEGTIKSLKDLKVKRVTIVGGEAAVSKEIENKIKSMGILVDRIYGKNREETSVKIAKKYMINPELIVVTNGYVFADSVVGGYYAYKKNAPIILTRRDILSDESFNYIKDTKQNTVILGLYSAIGKTVESELNIILKTAKFKGEFFLLPIKGNYDKLEANMMIDRIMSINSKIVRNIYIADVRMKLCNGPITDDPEYAYLKGVVPRGWEGLGKTWDDVPGAGGTDRPIARIGYSNPGDDTGHNSINLELHELAHTIDNYISGYYSGEEISNSNKFIKIWKEEAKKILPEDYFISYSEEYFAETFAMYYLNDVSNSALLKKAPKTYAFIKNLDDLKLEVSINKMKQPEKIDLRNIVTP